MGYEGFLPEFHYQMHVCSKVEKEGFLLYRTLYLIGVYDPVGFVTNANRTKLWQHVTNLWLKYCYWQVKFSKGKATEDAGATGSSSPAATTAPSTTTSAAPTEKETPEPSASSADYLASLSRATSSAAATDADDKPTTTGGDVPAASAGARSTAAAAAAARPPVRPESPFEAFDQEFRDFAKAMWGEEAVESLRVPTQEELADKAAAAKKAWAKREAEMKERAKARMEARAKRVMAMRRATMAANVSQADDGSVYLVK